MGKESIVEIPRGSGNKYRYQYDEEIGKTLYVGPVGDAPSVSEEDFLRTVTEKELEEKWGVRISDVKHKIFKTGRQDVEEVWKFPATGWYRLYPTRTDVWEVSVQSIDDRHSNRYPMKFEIPIYTRSPFEGVYPSQSEPPNLSTVLTSFYHKVAYIERHNIQNFDEWAEVRRFHKGNWPPYQEDLKARISWAEKDVDRWRVKRIIGDQYRDLLNITEDMEKREGKEWWKKSEYKGMTIESATFGMQEGSRNFYTTGNPERDQELRDKGYNIVPKEEKP